MGTTSLVTGLGAGAPAIGPHKALLGKVRVTIPAATWATAEVLQVFPVKAGWFVRNTIMKVIQAGAGTTFTASVGDGDAAAGFDAASDLKATAGTAYISAPGTDAYATAGGKLYAADDTIDLVLGLSSATGTAIVDLYVFGHDLNGV